MKAKNIRPSVRSVATILLGLCLGSSVIVSTLHASPVIVSTPAGDHQEKPPIVDPLEPLIKHWSVRLGLDQKQHDALKEVYKDFRTTVVPIFKDRHDAEVAIQEAVLAGKTEADIEHLHDQLSTDERELSVAQTTAYRKALALLTPDQLKHGAALFGLFAVGL